ncbi:ZIP family metal transporter [bacterium]|nr:ZIP family metal transporter [bacterium]
MLDNIWLLTKLTLIAGVGGTGLGGAIGALFKKDSSRTASLLLSFASGVMISIVCFELIDSAIATNVGIIKIIFSICFGVIMVYLLNLFIDKITNKEVHHIDELHPTTADDLDEIIHSNHLSVHIQKNDTKLSLFVAGIIMASAIALHNLPEGMTIGASFANSDGVLANSVLALSILIGFHNIPEGMAICVPLINGGLKRRFAVFVTALSGLPMILGAIIGYLIGDIGPLGLAMSLGFASGAMLYVIFGELLPQSILMYKSKLPAFFVLIGILIGIIVINY